MKIVVNGLRKSYGKKHVLRNITFEAGGGQCIGFVGDNGCGKTTMLTLLAGIEKPDGGSIETDGKISLLPQINPLPDNMKVREILKLWCDNSQIYKQTVDRYDCTSILNTKISKLSGGMKRRVAIACAMASGPDILIMDEPTAALDIRYKGIIHEDMRAFTREGGLLIIVTHEAEEIAMCDTCYQIKDGVNEVV